MQDTLAIIILELIGARQATQPDPRCDAFNLVNPSATTWSSLIPTLQKHFSVKPVDLTTWVHELEAIQDPSRAETAAKPALKLLEFYKSLAQDNGVLSCPLELSKAIRASATMRALRPIDYSLLENWLRQWGH
jgi:hypothetical protein